MDKIKETNGFKLAKEKGFTGFANLYLCKSWNESTKTNDADINFYERLIQFDNQFNVSTITEQVLQCVQVGLRTDIVAVSTIVF